MRLDIFSSSRRHVRKHINRWRVFLDDIEVTNRAQKLDTREGWVQLLVVDAQGRAQVDPRNRTEAWVTREHGSVRLKRRYRYGRAHRS